MHSLRQLRTRNGRVDEVYIVLSPRKISTNKWYMQQILKKEIIPAICAMLNSDGGNVVLYIDTESKDIPEFCSISSQMSLMVRMLEQSMKSILGSNKAISYIHREEDNASIVFSVKKADYLITTNYNLYLPSSTQVLQVDPWEPPERVKDDFIKRKVVPEPVQLGSHWKMFFKDNIFRVEESQTVQLKHLKADQSKRTKLADRMTGKNNKFSCYVSAFANRSGGHIYYGISDDRVVEGELIPNEKDKDEITKKVEKAINKMIWPEQICQPKRGEHWEIFFEPVADKNSRPTPSTFVIVIYIAPCLGGVFLEKPECYKMVDGNVKEMSFITWKKEILGAFNIEHRVSMSSINNGNAVWKKSESLRRRFTI